MKQGLFCLLIDDDADDSEFFRRTLQRFEPSIESRFPQCFNPALNFSFTHFLTL
jgi:hypothetical protein